MDKFTADQKMKIVILSFDPAANIDGICKKYEVTVAQLRDWKTRFLEGARAALAKPDNKRDTQEIRKDLEKTRVQLKKFLDGE